MCNYKSDQVPEKRRPYLLGAALILGLVAIWHLAVPFMGVSLAVTSGVWGLVTGTVMMLCVAALLFFMLPLIGVFIVSAFLFLWVCVAVVIFPIIFPVVVPVFLLCLFVGYRFKRR